MMICPENPCWQMTIILHQSKCDRHPVVKFTNFLKNKKLSQTDWPQSTCDHPMSKLIILLLITIVNMLHVHNTQQLGNNLIMAILQIPHLSVVDKLDGYHQNSKTWVVNNLRSINVLTTLQDSFFCSWYHD